MTEIRPRELPLDHGWLTVRKGGRRFTAFAIGGGRMKWRAKYDVGWRRYLPGLWATGSWDACVAVYAAFVRGAQT